MKNEVVSRCVIMRDVRLFARRSGGIKEMDEAVEPSRVTQPFPLSLSH